MQTGLRLIKYSEIVGKRSRTSSPAQRGSLYRSRLRKTDELGSSYVIDYIRRQFTGRNDGLLLDHFGRSSAGPNLSLVCDDTWEIAMKTQGEIEAAICKRMTIFEQEDMGRGLKNLQSHLIDDLLVVRL